MYLHSCTYIKGWSPGQSAAWARHCGSIAQGQVLVHSPWVLSCHPAMSLCRRSGQQHTLGSDLLWAHLFQPPRLLPSVPGAPPALLRLPGPMHGPPLSPPMHRSPCRAPAMHQPPKQQGLGLSAEMAGCQLSPSLSSGFGKAFRACSPRHQLSHRLPHHRHRSCGNRGSPISRLNSSNVSGEHEINPSFRLNSSCVPTSPTIFYITAPQTAAG